MLSKIFQKVVTNLKKVIRGVVVRASASRLGDLSSNITSAKILMIWGPHKYFIRAPVTKLGRETSNWIRV
jgi:hypothetical protein